MRITDSRYDRDRQRLAVAYRLIGHEARTQTIRQATGLSGDRIRKLYRDYFKGQPARPVRRRRGKSPRQMSFFRRSPAHELQAATLAPCCGSAGFIGRPQVLYRAALEEVGRFCDVYETFCALCPATVISFEHAWHLLARARPARRVRAARCPDCHGAVDPRHARPAAGQLRRLPGATRPTDARAEVARLRAPATSGSRRAHPQRLRGPLPRSRRAPAQGRGRRRGRARRSRTR